MAKNKIEPEFEYGWKALRDMARKGIGHSNLHSIANKLKRKSKKKDKK